MPQRWDRVYSAFDDIEQQTKLVQEQECISLLSMGQADMSDFSPAEMAVIDEVCRKMRPMSSRAISQMSHDEPAWKGHVGKPETIPFMDAFSLVNI